jgi:tyrosinase
MKEQLMTTRRTILKATLAVGTATVFSGPLGGLSAIAQTAPRVRRSLNGMSLDDPDLQAYRDFVGIMLAKDQKDLVSWLQYSLMHGQYDGNYRYCPHGDWYFLPWHREFMLMYERAARVLTKYTGFAMPYWDWTVDRTMPQAFTEPTYKGKPNPLYVDGRTLNTTDWPLKDSWVGADTLQQKVYDETSFQVFGTSKNPAQTDKNMSWVVLGGGFQGFLERTPHNLIHNAIGAYMPSAGSPRDPIFMMHHGNIDRIWTRWNALGRSNTASMSKSDADLWLSMVFQNNYISPAGEYYSSSPAKLQSTIALGYTYPDLPKPDRRKSEPARDARLLAALSGSAGVSTNLETLRALPAVNTEAATLKAPLAKSMRLPEGLQGLVGKAESDPASAEVFVILRDMEFSDAISSVRIFVNAGNVDANTPDSDPHFAGEVGFLTHPASAQGDHTGHQKRPPSAVVEVTDTVRRLQSAGELKGGQITVKLLPVLRQGAKVDDANKVVPALVEVVLV